MPWALWEEWALGGFVPLLLDGDFLLKAPRTLICPEEGFTRPAGSGPFHPLDSLSEMVGRTWEGDAQPALLAVGHSLSSSVWGRRGCLSL